VIALALMCSACSGALDVPPRPEVIAAPVEAEPTLAQTCFVRARFFRGLIPMKCADVARETRP
jgi:hypothetical protein